MFSVVIPPLASLNWPPWIKYSDRFPANFETLFALYHQLSIIFNSDSTISFIMYAAGTFLAVTAPAWVKLFYRKTRSMNRPTITPLVSEAEVNEDSPEARDEQVAAADSEYLTAEDAEYAEEMQFQEALRASIETQVMINTKPVNSKNKVDNPFCGICLENKESWQMFINDKCSHSFCYECTTNHILTTIQDRLRKTINCPGVNCKATLNFEACRMMIPDDALVQWDKLLCMSLIPEASKFYCPFRDCSTMLLNDSAVGGVVGMVKCVACKRSFCCECRVPWHSDFTCKEFQKLYAKNGKKKDEKIVKTLAKKKNWQKCPKCKMYVEKSEGCIHIVCRCEYQFCYRCGSKWTEKHGNCRQK